MRKLKYLRHSNKSKKITMSSLRKLLRNDKKLNAFNDEFDLDLLNLKAYKAKEENEDERDISVCLLMPIFNDIYKSYYTDVKQMLQNTSLTIDELEESLIANANRLQLLMQERANETFEKDYNNGGVYLIGDHDNLKVKSDLFDKDIYVGDASDSYIDGINIVMSYFRHYERIKGEGELKEPESINQFIRMSILTNALAVFKSCYDALIWEEGYVYKNNNEYTVRFKDKDYAILLKVGRFKMESYISAFMLKTMRRIKSDKYFKKVFENLYRAKRRARSLDKIVVKEGYIEPIIKKGFSDQHLFYDLSMNTAVAGYYLFISGSILPNTDTLTINDIITLFSEVRELISATSSFKLSKEGFLTIDSLYNYPFRIKERKLINYLQMKTTYTEKEIKSFVNIVIQNSDRVDFWKKPMIKRGEDLIFPILPIVGANVLNVLDEWLESGGFSLDQRGNIFEKYVKETIKQSMDDKGFYCDVYKENFLRVDEKFEEIDLFVEMRYCILIAEVKCVRYPIESRDKYNARDTIVKGIKQLNRKIGFVNSNKKILSKNIPGLLNKPIVKLLITNYPLFNTLIVDDVVVTDIASVEYYIDEGKIAKGFTSVDAFGNSDTSETQIIHYYNNELEFCKNINNHFANPVAVNDIKEMCIIEEIEITPEKSPIRIFFEAVKIEQYS